MEGITFQPCLVVKRLSRMTDTYVFPDRIWARQHIVTGLDGLGTTLITWVLSYEVGSIPTVTTNADVARESYMLYIRSGS